ncbi:MAG: hypothetical protein QW774_01685 [Candidatus Micrarchaeaceae archaeon]
MKFAVIGLTISAFELFPSIIFVSLKVQLNIKSFVFDPLKVISEFVLNMVFLQRIFEFDTPDAIVILNALQAPLVKKYEAFDFSIDKLHDE